MHRIRKSLESRDQVSAKRFKKYSIRFETLSKYIQGVKLSAGWYIGVWIKARTSSDFIFVRQTNLVNYTLVNHTWLNF